MSDTNIHDLKLHEEKRIYGGIHILRVPGGWLYQHKGSHERSGYITFVPYS